MRKIFSVLIILGFIAAAVIIYTAYKLSGIFSPVPDLEPEMAIEATPTPAYLKVALDSGSYSLLFYRVKPDETVRLVPNFSQKLSARTAKTERNCRVITNAGFYTPDARPIGLFQISDNTIGSFAENPTFNAFVSKSASGGYAIGNPLPTEKTDWIFQTGPLLIRDHQVLSLKIINDENARRMVAATTGDGNLILMMFFDENLTTDGPKLAQLPEFIRAADKTFKLNIRNAVNLDGGSAAAFLSIEGSIPEITGVGSFLCIAEK
jgi:uncharacterized protein YigE (DUF2233 family)